MRRRDVIALGIATAITGATVFVAIDRNVSDESEPAARSSPSPVATLDRPAVLAALHSTAPPPSAELAGSVIEAAVSTLPAGEQLVGSVVDVTNGRTLWSRDPDTALPPASTTKLLTAAAALRALGPDFHFTTETKQAGNAVYLIGGGDPTLVRDETSPVVPAYPTPASLATLAKATADALTPGARIHLRVDTSAWSGPQLAAGWSPGYVTEGDVTPPSVLELDGGRLHPGDFDSERTPTPTAQAVEAFKALLEADGVVVKGEVKAVTTPETATSLASVQSPPLSALVVRLLTVSDNDLAEALGRAVAEHDGLPADFTGAADAVTQEIAGLDVLSSAITLNDTSGLSHDDLVTPSTLTAVLQAAASADHPQLRPVVEGLPVAGFSGTLAMRYRGHGAKGGAGDVRAKTGTLVGVDSLAGYVVDSTGRLLAFAFLATGPGAEYDVEHGLDRITSALAGLT